MRIEHFLVEGRGDYEAMFRGILSDPEINDRDKDWLMSRIKWAQNVLKKSDRVIWYLRYIKAIVMDANVKPTSAEEEILPGQEWVRTFDPVCLTPNTPWRYHSVASQQFTDQIEHFMSLDCYEIKQMTFGKKGLQEVMRGLYDFERDWAREQTGRIPVDHPSNEDAEVILDFNNGWQWLNLNRASCHEEGSAMGHCGNSPRSHTGDTILSLRKLVTKAGKPAYEPHLTFTMDENFYLSERKGRANEKPNPRYHEMIVALLLLRRGKHFYIDGIGDSHWETQKDFVIDDLNPQLRAKTLEERPEFGNALEYWNGTGPYEANFNILQGKIMKALHGRYQTNVVVEPSKEATDEYEVRCPLSIPTSFQKALNGDLISDPFSMGGFKQSERWKNRRARARQRHEEEINTLVDAVIAESLEDTRQRLDRLASGLRPFFRVDRQAGFSAHFEHRVYATAPIDWFLKTLVGKGAAGEEHMKVLIQLMNGTSALSKDLDRFGDNEIMRVRSMVKARIEELVKQDIADLGDVEGEAFPDEDLPEEDWEQELLHPRWNN
jgi:hypothetical protein